MRLLLDTCVFLWLACDPERLSARARRAVDDCGSGLFLSAMSAWEIARKHDVGKLQLPEVPERLLPKIRAELRIASLPLGEADVLATERLPRLHADPIDRLLIAQAIEHGLTLLTPDEQIARYPVKTLW